MATLDELKTALRKDGPVFSQQRPHSAEEYKAGFDILSRGSIAYKDFIVPQLSELLTPIFHSRLNVSVLEIGPGPKSALGSLPEHLRRKVHRYVAFEPNELYASDIENWIRPSQHAPSPFLGLNSPPKIVREPFTSDADQNRGSINGSDDGFDIVLFCHSMYGMSPKRAYIEAAIEALSKQQERGAVIVFHRDGVLSFDGLVSSQVALFPTGTVSVADDDATLDTFASFVAGYELQQTQDNRAVRCEWRKTCRTGGGGIDGNSHLTFRSPTVMVVFNQHAARLPELLADGPPSTVPRNVKSPEARHSRPASIVRPTCIQHIQECVRWALKYGLNMTVFGGGHSGQCLRSNVVAVDMSAFSHINVVRDTSNLDQRLLTVVQSGCTSGDVIRKALEQGVTVPLGARPSVGAGLWLQGGIGHLSRLHGLACDSIIGAVLVCVKSGQVHVVGDVPSQHTPADAVRPTDDHELLWALKGAGRNFGIVVSVVFKTYPAPLTAVRNWVAPSISTAEAACRLLKLSKLATSLPDEYSLDAFLYHQDDQLHVGSTLFQTSSDRSPHDYLAAEACLSEILGPSKTFTSTADSIQLFDADMYVSGMHGGHGGGKTSSFKRCVFLRSIGVSDAINTILSALENRPSNMSYMHLLHGGGAVSSVAGNDTAFGCREWEYACVITGVWPQELDGSPTARDVVDWVYDTAQKLLQFSAGVYGADLGQDQRDARLAVQAFGPNATRLARLKQKMDPHAILPHACPLPLLPRLPKVIILVTGHVCAGKDFCADAWAAAFRENGLAASVVSISDVTKKEYAAAVGADAARLLSDRGYKEQHRPALTTFYQDQVKHRPWLPEEHFLHVVYSAADIDVMLVTGMRDEAPVASFSYLVPHSRVLEVRVDASKEVREGRGGPESLSNDEVMDRMSASTDASYYPDLTFKNDDSGSNKAKLFAQNNLLTLFDPELQRLADMVRSVADFPSPGVQFRHVLGIAQQPGGFPLCTSLLRTSFIDDWSKINAVVSCDAGGFLFASPLAAEVDRPLALVREVGKLPPPIVSVPKDQSHISALDSSETGAKTMCVARDVIKVDGPVVVVDDVLASGKTLCAVLRLLAMTGVSMKNVRVIVVAEFPVHRGREYLRQQGFGSVQIQNLLVFGGA